MIFCAKYGNQVLSFKIYNIYLDVRLVILYILIMKIKLLRNNFRKNIRRTINETGMGFIQRRSLGERNQRA